MLYFSVRRKDASIERHPHFRELSFPAELCARRHEYMHGSGASLLLCKSVDVAEKSPVSPYRVRVYFYRNPRPTDIQILPITRFHTNFIHKFRDSIISCTMNVYPVRCFFPLSRGWSLFFFFFSPPFPSSYCEYLTYPWWYFIYFFSSSKITVYLNISNLTLLDRNKYLRNNIFPTKFVFFRQIFYNSKLHRTILYDLWDQKKETEKWGKNINRLLHLWKEVKENRRERKGKEDEEEM